MTPLVTGEKTWPSHRRKAKQTRTQLDSMSRMTKTRSRWLVAAPSALPNARKKKSRALKTHQEMPHASEDHIEALLAAICRVEPFQTSLEELRLPAGATAARHFLAL